ncbi:MAG: hypothetical protein NZM26_01825 [Patescibacteria group bacterium]|nr:hypothetical protein [Patescibacteria group bacterium]
MGVDRDPILSRRGCLREVAKIGGSFTLGLALCKLTERPSQPLILVPREGSTTIEIEDPEAITPDLNGLRITVEQLASSVADEDTRNRIYEAFNACAKQIANLEAKVADERLKTRTLLNASLQVSPIIERLARTDVPNGTELAQETIGLLDAFKILLQPDDAQKNQILAIVDNPVSPLRPAFDFLRFLSNIKDEKGGKGVLNDIEEMANKTHMRYVPQIDRFISFLQTLNDLADTWVKNAANIVSNFFRSAIVFVARGINPQRYINEKAILDDLEASNRYLRSVFGLTITAEEKNNLLDFLQKLRTLIDSNNESTR